MLFLLKFLQSHKLDLFTYLPKFEMLLILRPLSHNKGNFFPKWLFKNMFTLMLVLGRKIIIFLGMTLQFLLASLILERYKCDFPEFQLYVLHS